MSDEPKPGRGSDEELLGRLLDGLAEGAELDALLTDGPAAGERRAYLETLGLVGLSVPPMTPPAALRRRLLETVTGAGGEVTGSPRVAPVALRPAATRSPASRWALPLAATLAVALAGFSGWQYGQLSEQRTTIDQLSARLGEIEARAPGADQMRSRLDELQARLALVTGRGVEVCPLRPMPAATSADSRGLLFVAADHQHWYLTIEGLLPCAEGRSYQLWFVPADGEPVSAGTFDVVAGVRVELSSRQMPKGTRAVTVTLEPSGGSESPTGPAVLHGDQVMAVL